VHFGWQVTRIDSEMQTLSVSSEPSVDLSGPQNAILEMKEVLSSRLQPFYRYALRLLGNAAEAEEAVQEALLVAYRHIDQSRSSRR
jgi:hypothetical protein